MTDKKELIAELRLQAKHQERRINLSFAALLTQAAAALEAAERDAVRLDYLDTQRGDDVGLLADGTPELRAHYWAVDGQCHDVRTAIDYWMDAELPAPPKKED